jgi:hypothetical protein
MSSLLVRRGIILLAVSLTVILPAAGQQSVRAEAPESPAFFYDGSGQRAITASSSEFIVRVKTNAGVSSPGRPACLPARSLPSDLPASAAKLEDILERRGLYVARGSSYAALLSQPEIEYALPIVRLADDGLPLYPTDRLITALRPGEDAGKLADFAAAHGCELRQCERGAGRYLLRIRDTRMTSPIAVANMLHERSELVLYAHPDFIIPKVTQSPPVIQDPYYLSHQWHLDGDTSKGADAGSDINVETAWDSINGPNAQGVPEVRVAILDECVEKWHPDLFPNWAAGLDLDPDPPDDDPSPDGGQQHGTACAGVAVAVGNTIGVRGAAPNCGLIGVKFFGATVAEMADGFYFCVDPNDDGDHSDGAAVLSNSWSFASGTLQPPDVVNAINFATNSGRNGLGCLVLFAAANNDHTINGVTAIAQLPSVMAVGGTNSHAKHTEFSDVGPELAIATPTNDRGDDGVRLGWLNITTVDNTGSSGYNGLPDLDYTNGFGGTSSATPLAAGILGLIISQDPTMTAAQARAILQHTAVRIDEPYGRFDPVTSHSHRYGFGRADAGQAVVAANAGTRWPDRIKTMSATAIGNDTLLVWSPPPNDYAGSILVRSDKPLAWQPTDGQSYTLGQVVAPSVQIIYMDTLGTYTDVGSAAGAFFYAVFPRSPLNRYGFGAKAHLFRSSINILYDNSEGADPGWTHGGVYDEWTRGTPTSANNIFGQSVSGSGPLAGLNGTRAINGNKCWGTDLTYTYDANTDSYLQTPLLNLTGVTTPVFLEYWDWCLLETYYDVCTVEAVDASGQLIGYIDPDTGGDYDWTKRVYDLSPFCGQPIRIRFHIVADDQYQRDGWFIDEVRVVAVGTTTLPPAARDIYAETPADTPVMLSLLATDPNLGDTLDYVISSLPQHGSLTDPGGGAITTVPYVLAGHQRFANYTPASGYQGPDGFTYHANDGALNSNEAAVTLSVGTPVPAYVYDLSTDPGWITEGAWAYGHPVGAGGDPANGYTGSNVYGYNLAGAYTNNMPPRRLTMLPINCTGLSRVTLGFARWLGTEAGSYDKATIEASVDGASWTTVWSYAGSTNLQETAWSQQSYSLSAVADNQPFVLIRWVMGPTDGSDTFSGWNIDDVVISAIGTPPTNQPPYASDVASFTAVNQEVETALQAVDPDSDPLDYVILSLPDNGQLSDPAGGTITAVPYTLLGHGNIVVYHPDPLFIGYDGFQYRASDGVQSSNSAEVAVEVLQPASFPFTEDFEAGAPLASSWQTHSTNTGRMEVTAANGPIGAYHLAMDSTTASSYGLNELTLVVDLVGHSMVILEYDWKNFSDEAHQLPASWTGSAEGDGVAVSIDGITWHRVANLTGGTAGVYQNVRIDLDDSVAAAGLSYTSTFRIRFQQYDNNPIPDDGLAVDNIELIQGTDDPLIATTTLPSARLDQAYVASLTAIGGDPPLVWTTVDAYDEQDLGASNFSTVGVAQGWTGDDKVFDYTLPFSFPFWGGSYTAIKVGTDGWLNFGAYVGSTYNNSTALLRANKRIAVLWDDLRTDQGGDIYVDASVPGQVTFRWSAVTRSGLYPCNFAATLYDIGDIHFHYGAGNTHLTPTIGISAGEGTSSPRYLLTSYDGLATLTNANSLKLEWLALPPGLTLESDGDIVGVPTRLGTFRPLFKVTDATSRTDTRQVPVIVAQFGDFDGDGDVDNQDFAQFRVCYTGSGGGPIAEACQAGDDDGDDDVDCLDWLAFRTAFENSEGYTPLLTVEEFVAILLEPDPEAVESCIADLTDDGSADGEDIEPFVNLLLEG